MLFKPTIGTDLSGKLGGIVASHNAGGPYFRIATIPTNPNTPQQVVVRNAVALLTAAWAGTLTQVQRDSWDLYAANVTLTNRIGEQHNISGIAMYVRSNVGRIQISQARVDTGPPIFNLGGMRAPTLANATAAGQTVDVGFFVAPIDNPWANEVGGSLLIYLSRPQNPGIQFFINPYRFATFVAGDPIPPVSPVTVAAPFVFVAGQRLFARFVAHTADGRVSADTRATILAVA